MGTAALRRMTKQWPERAARPTSRPCVRGFNQVEIYFSVVQRKVLTPNDFADLGEVKSRLAAFERRYEHTGRALRVAFYP